LNLHEFDELVNNKSMHAEWKAMSRLMMRDWFSRRWIVQEITLAKQAILLCGKHKLDWLKYADECACGVAQIPQKSGEHGKRNEATKGKT
jgi:hypothetical protein